MTPAPAMRVLIVEDEVDLGEVFQDYLVGLGHQVDVVASAEAALERLREQRPDAMVLDLKLPGMSGLEFMSLPLVHEGGFPVIVISGHATEHQARECLRLGALEFLAKPAPLEILGRLLEDAEVFGASPGAGKRRERRGTRRFGVSLPVRIVHDQGKVASGQVVEVSATGLRARLNATLTTGATVRVSITMPDAAAPLEVVALVVRTDFDGAAVWFFDLAPADADRLLALAR